MGKGKKSILPAVELKKSYFQARYKAKIRFYDLLRSAAESLDRYEHWETNGLIFNKYDYKNRCSSAIAYNNFSYEQDSSDVSLEDANIIDLINKMPDVLELSSYDRLGFRRLYLMPVAMKFNELVTILYYKLFSQDAALTKIIPSKTEDLMYRLDASDDSFKYHITLGPVRKKEIPKYISVNKKLHLHPDELLKQEELSDIITAYPELAVLIDIDVYRDVDDISIADSTDIYYAAREKIVSFIAGIRTYLFQ